MTDQEHKDKIVNKALIYFQERIKQPESYVPTSDLDSAILDYLESRGISVKKFKKLDLEPDDLDP